MTVWRRLRGRARPPLRKEEARRGQNADIVPEPLLVNHNVTGRRPHCFLIAVAVRIAHREKESGRGLRLTHNKRREQE